MAYNAPMKPSEELRDRESAADQYQGQAYAYADVLRLLRNPTMRSRAELVTLLEERHAAASQTRDRCRARARELREWLSDAPEKPG